MEAVRKAEAAGARVPEWVPYSASDHCQLCRADFFWGSTLRSEVRRYEDGVLHEMRCVCCRRKGVEEGGGGAGEERTGCRKPDAAYGVLRGAIRSE